MTPSVRIRSIGNVGGVNGSGAVGRYARELDRSVYGHGDWSTSGPREFVGDDLAGDRAARAAPALPGVLGKSRHRGPNSGLPLPPSDFGVRGVLPWIVIIWSGSTRVTARATAGCGRISTMLPPCPLRVLATSNRSDIAAESAKRKPDTSIISCRVISDSWEVITPLSCVIVLISATPDNTISGPDAPAATDVWSKLTAPYIPAAKRTHYPDTHDFEAGVGVRCRSRDLAAPPRPPGR